MPSGGNDRTSVPSWRQRWSTDAVEAGLRWLTNRWPGGTVRNEAEAYSGYYTEVASVSQACKSPSPGDPTPVNPEARLTSKQ